MNLEFWQIAVNCYYQLCEEYSELIVQDNTVKYNIQLDKKQLLTLSSLIKIAMHSYYQYLTGINESQVLVECSELLLPAESK